ncbi:hypothetical protein DFJ58DRAFT_776431 [Suillus subalutaceus]|uniref:uncharacterized protein n=1 Tax=Suillus subalutaceus TaxID=48586 RepID=UPI001B88704F|nr:uncharacterized protein DFJ58DRAFT_776431 [Suillus subalutaceus]KAG1862096.1 hypothetical protein DFJ58DRAFT_776431 [Suillus subalutaceus]
MPPSTSQVRVIYLPGIGETRVITLPSMRDVVQGSFMNDTHFYDTTLLYIFLGWFRASVSLWSRFTPFFGVFAYFIGSCGTKHLPYVSILISTAIFFGRHDYKQT